MLSALADALTGLDPHQPIGVACSGGVDSAALAAVSARYQQSGGPPVVLLHVHHGLQSQADQWSARVGTLADKLGVPVLVRHVRVDISLGLGIEGAAREARYEAIAEMAAQAGISTVLLAHHRGDQAETVLLRLLRGAGVHGMAAMRSRSGRGALQLIRPWLDTDRAHIVAFMAEFSRRTAWEPVADPSNTDPGYARGALRSAVVPALRAHWPSWERTLSRHARQSREIAELLDEVAAQDLASLDPGPPDESFSLQLWRELSGPRQALVLRHWIALQGARMPVTRRLDELLRQLRALHALGHDRQLLWQHGPLTVRVVHGRVIASSR